MHSHPVNHKFGLIVERHPSNFQANHQPNKFPTSCVCVLDYILYPYINTTIHDDNIAMLKKMVRIL
jgi:hypothetical protein